MAINLSGKSDMSAPHGSPRLSGCRRLFRFESDAHADPRDPMGDASTRNARNRIELEILEIQACNDAGYW
jgi:hypothetical protein